MLLVGRRTMAVVLGGVAVGMVLAFLLGHSLSRFFFVSGSDLVSIGSASLFLALVAAVACYLSARSASRVDARVALREARMRRSFTGLSESQSQGG